MWRLLKTYWFLAGLSVAVALAYAAPAAPVRLGRGVDILRTACIAGIFLAGGLTLPTRVLRSSIGHWRLHVFIQAFNLGLIPLLFYGLRPILERAGMPAELAGGFVILACVPTTVASSVAMTAMAGGNEAAAICNSTIGNLLGVFWSPVLVYLTLSLRGGMDWSRVLTELTLLVFAPLLAGQMLRLPFDAVIALRRRRIAVVSQVFLLIVIYFVFTATFAGDFIVPGLSLAAVIAVALAAHVALLALNWRLSGTVTRRFGRADRITALMCGTQKTVALGIPLIAVIFENDPLAGMISVPLLCYHPIQLLIGSALAVRLRAGGVTDRKPA